MTQREYEITHDLQATWDRGGVITEVGPGLFAWIPSVMRTTVNDCLVTLELARTSAGMRPTSVTVTTIDGRQVSTAVLRSIPLGEVTRAAIESAIYRKNEDGTMPMLPAAFVDRNEGLKGDAQPKTLRRVAEVFEVAQVLGVPPAKYVQNAFGLPRSTAGYWISQARKHGFLAAPGRESEK